jgi:hypothetical protein
LRPKTLDIEELEIVNEKIREISAVAGDNAPSFICNDKIAFMSSDNIIMCYKVFNVEDGK